MVNDDEKVVKTSTCISDCPNIYQLISHPYSMANNQYGFKMWPNCNETATSERFLSWPNHIFSAKWNALFALEQFFHIAIKTAMATLPTSTYHTRFVGEHYGWYPKSTPIVLYTQLNTSMIWTIQHIS